MGIETVALIAMAASAAASYYNTQQTAKKQDSQLAESIQNQSRKQREADAKVDAQVDTLEGSSSSDEQATRMNQYMQTLAAQKATTEGGLNPTTGSAAFAQDASEARTDVASRAQQAAGLMSRIDAPGMQRQGEAFGYGRLATDIDLIGRESRGQAFIDDMRLRAIRRNPGIDFAAGLVGGAASSYGGGGKV